MEQETNKEMDLLLRRLSRSASDSSNDGNHLDADELSSYAENALPGAARARYTEHLAECASCRKLVAQLASSGAVVSATETARVSEPSALRKFLASLFSPMVLRYAVPALGLIVVAVIGLTVLRRNERADSVAQLTEQERRKATSAQLEQAPSRSPSAGLSDNQQEKAPAVTAASRPERAKETQPAPPPNQSPSVSATADVNQAAAPTTTGAAQTAANEPVAPKPTPADEEKQKRAESEARRQEVQGRAESEVSKERASDAAKAEDRKSDDDFARTPGPASKSIASLRRNAIEEKDKSDADTRSVAGRRFRRERGIWIDTAYDSSRSTVHLTRGSEQYRALVADEPAIKRIADQLDGEIIVVWKGHAYRIR